MKTKSAIEIYQTMIVILVIKIAIYLNKMGNLRSMLGVKERKQVIEKGIRSRSLTLKYLIILNMMIIEFKIIKF